MDAYSSFARRPPVQPAGTDAFDALAAWRAPEARRFDMRVANDTVARTNQEDVWDVQWDGPVMRGLIIVGGAVFAALMGAMLGGAMSL